MKNDIVFTVLFCVISLGRSSYIEHDYPMKRKRSPTRKLPKEDKTDSPTLSPTMMSSTNPTLLPSTSSSTFPSNSPSEASEMPSELPTRAPIFAPSFFPSSTPSSQPIGEPTSMPSNKPSSFPSDSPTIASSGKPSLSPSYGPTIFKSQKPSQHPSILPSFFPSQIPSGGPSAAPIVIPSTAPSVPPTSMPTSSPTIDPNKLVFLSASIDTVIQFVPNKMSSIQKEMYKDDVQAFLAALFLKTVPPIEDVEVLVGNQILEEQPNRRQRQRQLQFVQGPVFTLQVQILVSGHYVNTLELLSQEVDLAAYLNSFFTTHGHVLRDFIKGRHVNYFDDVQRIFPVQINQVQPIIKQESFFTTNTFQIALISVCAVLLVAVFFLIYVWVRKASKTASRDDLQPSYMMTARNFGDTIDYLDGKKEVETKTGAVTSSETKPLTEKDKIESTPKILREETDFNKDVARTPVPNSKSYSSKLNNNDNRNPSHHKESNRIPRENSFDEADLNADGRDSYSRRREQTSRSNHHRQRRNYANRSKLPEINELEYNQEPVHSQHNTAYINGDNAHGGDHKHVSHDYHNSDASSVHSAPTQHAHEYHTAYGETSPAHSPPNNQHDYQTNNYTDPSSLHSVSHASPNGYRSPVNLPPNDHRPSHYNSDASSVHSVPNVRSNGYRSPTPNDYRSSPINQVSPTSSDTGHHYQNNRSHYQSDASSVHSMPTARVRTPATHRSSTTYNDAQSVHSASHVHGDGYRSPTNIDENSVNSHSRTQRHDHRSYNVDSPNYPLPRTISPQYSDRKASEDRRYINDDISSVTSFRSDIYSIADSLETEKLSSWNRRDCFAPPGKLGLAVRSSSLGPVVTSLHDLSPLKGQMFPGDFIIAIDDLDTRGMPAEILTKVSESRKLNERRFTVMSKKAISQT